MIEEVYKDEFEGLTEFLEYNNIECSDTEEELKDKKRIWNMKEIIMFTSNNCPGCMQAKRAFDESGVKVTEMNVEEHDGHIMAMQYGLRGGLPVFVVAGEPDKRFMGWHGSIEAFNQWKEEVS